MTTRENDRHRYFFLVSGNCVWTAPVFKVNECGYFHCFSNSSADFHFSRYGDIRDFAFFYGGFKS